MDNNKIRREIRFIWLVLIILLVVNSLNLYLTFATPKGGFYPSQIVKEGPKGDTPEIDYKLIASMVEQQTAQRVSSIPLPKNGSDGKDGESIRGADGKDAVVDYDKVRSLIQEEVFKLPIPSQGDIGVAGREVEFQTNPKTNNLEWRYIGDDSWQILMRNCQITNTCQ